MARRRNLLDEIKGKAALEGVKLLLHKLGVFSIMGAIASAIASGALAYSRQAPTLEVILVGFAGFLIGYICIILCILLWKAWPSKSDLLLIGSSHSQWPPPPYLAPQVVIRNKAETDADNLQIELLFAEGYTARDGMPPLPFTLAPGSYHLNPGAVTLVIFMKARRGEQHTENGILYSVDCFFSAVGAALAAPCMSAEINRNYRLVFKVTARNKTPIETALNLRFSYGGEPLAFGYALTRA